MKIKVPKDINIAKFIDWIKTNTKCQVRINQKRLEIVVEADNIEKGLLVPLIAYMDGNTLAIIELTQEYYEKDQAWQALETSAPAYAPVPFYDWVKDQYLTSKNVKVERIF
ncbi:MAG TPA: hypothetical protein VFD02_00455 [Syntrophomonadaceae bacterium]|nr:hypothetical protein [Syntrophomonadaceae bacterium]